MARFLKAEFSQPVEHVTDEQVLVMQSNGTWNNFPRRFP